MQLDWKYNGGDAWADGGNAVYPILYEIEQASSNRYWAFRNGKPCGVLETMTEAQTRCQDLQDSDDAICIENHKL